MEFRINNFDFIRLFAATQVVIGHGFRDFDIEMNPFVKQILSAFPGVPIFFVISGFLISASLDRNPSLGRYFVNRFLRIYPGLWVCFLVSLLSIAVFYRPVVSLGEFVPWVLAQVSVGQFYNPEFLRGYGIGVLNGSLWTIPVELQFYILLPVLYWLLDRMSWSKWFICTFLAFLIIVNQIFWSYSLGNESIFAKLAGVTVFPYLFMFFLGVLLQKNQRFIEKYLKDKFLVIFAAYCALSMAAFLLGFRHGGTSFNPVSAVGLSLLVISLAYSYNGKLSNPLKGNDLSYGIYIYHMIWANMLVHHSSLPGLVNFSLVITATFASAALSWKFVEKPALGLKSSGLIAFKFPWNRGV